VLSGGSLFRAYAEGGLRFLDMPAPQWWLNYGGV
jgi:hypothetical protein